MRVIENGRLNRLSLTLRAAARRWREDRKGATLVQFVVVLPVFVMVVLGTYGMFRVMAARDTLCEATWEATRYLQVEGPHFPLDDPTFDYPGGWEIIATEIMNQELASRTMIGLHPIRKEDVTLWPEMPRRSPEDTLSVSREELNENFFYLKVTKSITNPLGMIFDMPNDEPGKIKLQCRMGGFYEGPPVQPTLLQRNPGNRSGCDRPIQQCPIGSGETDTPIPSEGTPTVCPTCRK